MTKYHSIDEVNPDCKKLKEAYNRAYENAFVSIPRPQYDVRWSDNFGNAVSTKGTLIGKSVCDGCGKRVEVIFRLCPIEAKDLEGNDVKLFDTISGDETIILSGHQCKER